MNCEIINELKGKYRDFLLTDKGKEVLKGAVILQKRWNDRLKKYSRIGKVGSAHQKSKYVKMELLPQAIQDKMTLIKITPIGLNNHCHDNAEYFCENGFNSRTGFNVFACPCGKYFTFERHSVSEKDGKLYDFTKDMDEEQEKWFLEVKTRHTFRELMSVFSRENILMNLGCKCRIEWEHLDLLTRKTPDSLLKEIESMEQIRIWN